MACFKEDALIDRWRLYKIAHLDNIRIPERFIFVLVVCLYCPKREEPSHDEDHFRHGGSRGCSMPASVLVGTIPAEAQNLKIAEGVDVQIGRDRDRRRNDSDVTVGIGSGGVTVGPRQNCRMVTTTVERPDGRTITRKERRCD